MTKKKAIYAQNARKWTPQRHKRYQETLAKKRAEKAVKDRELGEMINHFAKDTSPQVSIMSNANAGMNMEAVPTYSELSQRIDALRQKNESLKAKLDVYEDLLFRAIKD